MYQGLEVHVLAGFPLLQIASGAVYGDDDKGRRRDPTYKLLDQSRYALVADLVEARDHSVVFYNWKHQREELKLAFEALWLEALRSGEYKQSVARMRVTLRSGSDLCEKHGEGYCCLGVLTDIALKEGEIDQFRYNISAQAPTMAVMRWAWLDANAQSRLMRINDGNATLSGKPIDNINRKTFSEIAEWIEENL